MKKNWSNFKKILPFGLLLLILAGFGGYYFLKTNSIDGQPVDALEKPVYTCPMHPQILRDAPGVCPICHMDLVLKNPDTRDNSAGDLSSVLLPVNSTLVANLQTISPEEKSLAIEYKTQGFIDYDTRTFSAIAAKISGRIEKINVKYDFQPVVKGQELFRIYSPELVTEQENFIFLLANDPTALPMLEAARRKLRLLGFTENQLAYLEKEHKALMAFPVYSPIGGHIQERQNDNGRTQTSGSMINNGLENARELSIRAGTYIEKGQTLFTVVNPSKVWARLEILAADISKIKVGQAVTLTVENDTTKEIQAKIDFIEPFGNPSGKTLGARVYLNNPGHQLKVGNWVQARVVSTSKKALWLPRKAVLDLGQQHFVWLKNKDVFEAHRVETGLQEGRQIEILNGLSSRDEVAYDAQYLVDSEDFVKIK